MTDLNNIVELQEIASSDFHAKAGKELPENTPIATQDAIIEALRTVQDPELMLDIYSLGMIYKIDKDVLANRARIYRQRPCTKWDIKSAIG